MISLRQISLLYQRKVKKDKNLSKLGEMGAQRATVVLTNIHMDLVVILGEFGAKRANFHIS